MIYFKEKDHIYTSDKNEIYTSVSSLYSKYKPVFDKDYWSTYKALQKIDANFVSKARKLSTSLPKGVKKLEQEFLSSNRELFLKTKNEILASWLDKNKNSVLKGNTYHKDAEKMAYIRKVVENPFTKTAYKVITTDKLQDYSNHSICENLYDLKDGYYPELLIWNDYYKVAGQSDKVFISTEKDIRYVDFDDFKTNKKIDTKGFKGEKMLSPLSHLENCNFIHYSLAISCYAFMMEKFGFTIRNLGFSHYNVLYKTEYLKNEVEKIMEINRLKFEL